MGTESKERGKGRVLAVDAAPASLLVLKNKLTAMGHQVTGAGSSEEAQSILSLVGSASFDCLITDCCMADQTGLDLLLWLREHDPTLASIIMSRDANERLLTRMLRCGASDFLEKPVMSEELKSSLARTLESTYRRRQHAATTSAVIEAGLVQRRMNDPESTRRHPSPLTVCYHPYHEAGGDSISFFPLADGRMLILVADVSGHSLKSAFISAYFQGMLRGLVEQQVPIRQILERFNRFLVDEWNASALGDTGALPEIMSLSVCAVIIDPKHVSMRLLSGGFPIVYRLSAAGRPTPCGEPSGNPLGWFHPVDIAELDFSWEPGDQLIIWTDGLEEFAHQLEVDDWSLAFRVLQARLAAETPVCLKQAPDDLLLIVAGLPNPAAQPGRFPVFCRVYAKADLPQIDVMQGAWQRSLRMALPELAPSRLADALLCCREAVLNALNHGCAKDTDKATLTMVIDSANHELEIEVADSGPGYERATDVRLPHDHCGLVIIQELPQRVELASSGAVVRMFFTTVRPEEERL